jgi:penicillin-binding protein 2
MAGEVMVRRKFSRTQLLRFGAGNERANAWFVGLPPRRNPDIAVVVLRDGGLGADAAAPSAVRVIEAYVDNKHHLNHNLIAATSGELSAAHLATAPGRAIHPDAVIQGDYFAAPVQ